ncbi:hypothetical protein C0995_008157 [Termitomyces sp. Mi166|nr:hypothetical protein C0995_008157 [Termitomyces sp. Mi166\
MDALNAPQQAEESQQDFKRHQNAVHRQATSSRVPLRALSDVETTTSKVVDEEELEILQLPRMPRQHIMIKEEVLECNVPADAESLQNTQKTWVIVAKTTTGMIDVVVNTTGTTETMVDPLDVVQNDLSQGSHLLHVKNAGWRNLHIL